MDDGPDYGYSMNDDRMDSDMDSMSEYKAATERLDAMDDGKRNWVRGYINGLLFAQCQDPRVDDYPLCVDFPHETYAGESVQPLTIQEFFDVLYYDVDDEGGIVYTKLTLMSNKYSSSVKLWIGTSEGSRGTPDEEWFTHPHVLTPEQAQEVLDGKN